MNKRDDLRINCQSIINLLIKVIQKILKSQKMVIQSDPLFENCFIKSLIFNCLIF